MLASSRKIQALLADRVQHGDDELTTVQTYVETTQAALHREHAALDRLLKTVSLEVTRLKTIYDDFMGDLSGLEFLSTPASASLNDQHRRMLQCLFGGSGTAVHSRLSLLYQNGSDPLTSVQEAIETFNSEHRTARGEEKTILAHAINRLEQLANHLELQSTETDS